jgi:hypothetical protein
MTSQRAPKQWQLSKCETITTFENWRQNLLYILSMDKDFGEVIDLVWEKKTSTNPHRGLEDDADLTTGKTKVQKNAILDLMLGQIANYCPVIARNTIVKGSTSLNNIWQKIRQHFGFESSGAHFLDLTQITREPDERPEDLFQRLSAFFEDNLLTANSSLTHHGEKITVDEDLSPSLENTIVVLWLQQLHPGLPQLVKQKYGSELRNKTLASLKPEISQALSSLLDELRSIEDTRAFRSVTTNKPKFPTRTKKMCTLCEAARRRGADTHWLRECVYLTEGDKRAIARARSVPEPDFIESEDESTPLQDLRPNALLDTGSQSARRVSIIQSPYLDAHYKHHPLRLTLDCGATTNMIRASTAHLIKLPIKPASQLAHQADGITPLDVVGECHVELTRGRYTFTLSALVVKKLDVDILAGTPFMANNDVAVRPAKKEVVINGEDIVRYGPVQQDAKSSSVRRAQAFLLRGPERQTVILPGEFLELQTPVDSEPDTLWALEPRFDTRSIPDADHLWPPLQEVKAVDHSVRLPNDTDTPVLVRKHQHVCQIRAVTPIGELGSTVTPLSEVPACPKQVPSSHSAVQLDPDDQLSVAMKQKFTLLHRQYSNVFNSSFGKYNGASGDIQGNVNMGPVLPPQRKGRMPHYNQEKLVTLQKKFDELEALGILAKPEEVNVSVEYLNLSFLVNKPNGGTRLVTAFGEVGYYSKPQPSLMPDVESTLRSIAGWKYLIKSDLQQSFYQIPLAHSSMKYCGVATPFKGVRVYTRCAMGMPGSETALEEVMSRVLGEFVQEGITAKIADDLYCGGDTPEEAYTNWGRVLEALHKNGLSLSASKTVICPKSTVVLGWVWSQGTLKASSHKIATLGATDPPKTVRALRSFIGAYKVLSRVLKGYAELLHPLDQIAAGRQSQEQVEWTDELLQHFSAAKQALKDHKTITLPRPQDAIWIVTDASVKCAGLGATMYVMDPTNNELKLAGFFNAKLKKNQITWLPCEVEALCIGVAVSHFAPYIVQSKEQTNLLTDSRPCVLAYQKLLRGEFSASTRVTTFLSTVSRYRVHVGHISGASNLLSDYASRHPITCPDGSCQLCRFVHETQESCIRGITVHEVLDGSVAMPFTNRAAWHGVQQDCPDLRRVHSHLKQGTRPTKKMTNVPDVKRYLQQVLIAHDGLLVVRDNTPFRRPSERERIVIPRNIIAGVLTALHLRFSHPSAYQLRRLATRYFYALNMDSVIDNITAACHHCTSLKHIPKQLAIQSTSTPPTCVGSSFAMDVMRRFKQCILVLRETVTSYTLSRIIASERHQDIRDALLVMCAEIRCLGDIKLTIRVDPAPGMVALQKDAALVRYGITLEVGRVKNKNKNPVAERAVEELGTELCHVNPHGGPVSEVGLAAATASLNARIRRDGLSSRELWTHRDQVTAEQLPLEDFALIHNQNKARQANHWPSAKSKVPSLNWGHKHKVCIGDLVYLKDERDKTCARDKYLVTSLEHDQCQVRKFTKSQFRSKVYDVPYSDVYPVLPTTTSNHTHELVTSDESDSDADQSVLSQEVSDHGDIHCDTVDNNPDIAEPLETDNTQFSDSDEPTIPEVVHDVDNLRRSGRSRRPPERYSPSKF